MADEQEVAPQTAEIEQTEDESFVSISDIAEASGLESKIFDNASDDEPEEELDENIEVEEPQGEPELEQPEESDSEGVKKRIGKLVEARNKAFEEVAELKAQLEDAKKNNEPAREKVESKGLDRFESIETIEELKQAEEDAEHLREWLLENPDGGEYKDLSGELHEVEYDQARQLTVATDRDLRKNIPQTAKRIAERQQFHQTALNTFDWFKDQSSPEHIEIKTILEKNQYLRDYFKKDPVAELTVAYAMEGIKAMNAKHASAKQKVQSAPKVPSAPMRATPTAIKKKGKDSKALLKQAMSGEIDDAVSYIESLL